MIFATNNQGKLKEIREILSNYEILSLADVSVSVDVLEDQDSFLGNATKKAKEVYSITKQASLADDSGLCIDSLDGWPGVMTHRFLGEDATDEERNLAIIEKCQGLSNRSAKVVCQLVYYDSLEKPITGTGILEGRIASCPRGEHGFGFDSIFELPNGKTLAELTFDEKNQCSARSLAAKDLKQKLDTIFLNDDVSEVYHK